MKNSNYIAEKVFNVNLKYARLQNQTKELFFRCLDEGREFEYFKAKLEELWGNIDYSYMQDDLAEYQALIHERNIEGRNIVREISKGEYGSLFALVPISVILKVNDKFQRVKEREYKNSLKSYAYKNDKQEYLKLKVPKYNNQIVPYYNKENKIVRFVQPSTYDSMIHNTNLTRAGWNTTLNDANDLGVRMFYIPYHSFSCPECLDHQEKPMTLEQVINLVGIAEETEGDILHPNCKCTLTFYDDYSQIQPLRDRGELEEEYHIRQKVNSLTLKKEEVLTDLRIEKMLGNQDEVDKLNQQRNKINKSIRELKEALPTDELKKQVVAINR